MGSLLWDPNKACPGLQGDLACSLHIYTMTLHELAERYTWEGVKAYHFQFHRKRIASGKEVYYPDDCVTTIVVTELIEYQ